MAITASFPSWETTVSFTFASLKVAHDILAATLAEDRLPCVGKCGYGASLLE